MIKISDRRHLVGHVHKKWESRLRGLPIAQSSLTIRPHEKDSRLLVFSVALEADLASVWALLCRERFIHSLSIMPRGGNRCPKCDCPAKAVRFHAQRLLDVTLRLPSASPPLYYVEAEHQETYPELIRRVGPYAARAYCASSHEWAVTLVDE